MKSWYYDINYKGLAKKFSKQNCWVNSLNYYFLDTLDTIPGTIKNFNRWLLVTFGKFNLKLQVSKMGFGVLR